MAVPFLAFRVFLLADPTARETFGEFLLALFEFLLGKRFAEQIVADVVAEVGRFA